MLALLDGGEHDYARSALPLLRSLGASRHLHVDTITRQEDLRPAGHKILLVASDRPLRSGLAVEIADFVRRGGGLILLHGTLAAWSSSGELAELARWAPGDVGRLTELVIRPDESHPLTRRLGSEWKVRDELYLSEGPPGGDAKVLLRSRWRFTDQVVAYERSHGEGRFVYVGLGHDASTFADERFQLLVHRAVLHASGAERGAPVGVGLVGYGAIARDHASAIAAIPGLQLAAVCDLSAERRDQASRDWAVRTFASSEQMLDNAAVGLVVVGTPPSAHSDSVLAALAAGKHVVCEKPFALRVDEVDRMIASAATRNAVLTVYQSRRWDPDYLAMRDVVRSGRIGDVFYLESFIGGFSHPCDFWHSHEPISGGTMYCGGR